MPAFVSLLNTFYFTESLMHKIFHQFFNQEYESEYCTGIFSDELDKLGYKNQVTTSWKLNNSRLRFFGRVRTLTVETFETKDERIKKGLGFLGSLEPGDILVVKGSSEFAYFGELMSRLSQEIGLAGAVIDGLTRDTYYTQTIDFPIMGKGYSPIDIKGRGRVDQTDVLIEIDGITIKPMDYLFGDSDGLVVIPSDIMQEALPHFNEAAREEFGIKQMIKEGKSILEILDVVKGF